MTTNYQSTKDVPLEIICKRLVQLADAVSNTKDKDAMSREFTMRIPAECDRDADLVLCEAATRLRDLNKENERLSKLIADHNSECISLCDPDRCGYAKYKRQCPDCPKDWVIDETRSIAE